ncbi:MAG: DNA polymerase III subunit alpha [Candidatus Pacebacteria bacterium]|nr:DNA polymerase III subunit alpha [Candidatus Paceibacterota bacterium]
MTKFTHLHVHSHYSLLDGLSKIDDLLEHIKSLGMDSVAITDHGVLYGAVEFAQKAKKAGVKPIIGCEFYVAPDSLHNKRPGIDDKRHHLILLAKNETGYKNLVKMVTIAHLEGFYYKPRIDENTLRQYSDGLIGLSACVQGKIPQLIINNNTVEAEKTALDYEKILGKGNFYLEMQDHEKIPDQAKANQGLIQISKNTGIPLVATNDCHYLNKEDAHAQDVLVLINTGAKIDDPERLNMQECDLSVRSPKEMAESFKKTPEAIENTQKIKDACNFEFEFGKIKLPEFALPKEKTAEKYLRELTLKGAEEKCSNYNYQERIDYELSVIEKTGFASYFLIVQDLINWAKGNGIVVGPGRGSAGGSLVSYCLGITDINPLDYDLLFERFLNPERISMPDIDIDFADRRRDEVIYYVSEKYGSDRVAQIITFGTMASRAVIRDTGRALQYPYNYCDQIAKMIPMGLSLEETLEKIPEFRQLYNTDTKAKDLIDVAKKLEGVARHASTHACGVVISKDPLDEIIPLQHSTNNEGSTVTQYEMTSVEALGMLKMDFLGLKNLTTIEDTLSKIYAIYKKNIDISSLPLDDKKTYQLLQKGETIGVFQLESGGMQRYLKQLKPTEFEDIIAMVALYRPGPMELIPDYIARKNKQKAPEYIHPKLKPILESTYSIPLYQEQVMKMAQDLAGFSLSEADILRKAMGKKIKSLLDEQKDKFIDGCIKNGVEDKVAQQIWDWITPFASYGFNKSHSAGYATIAYQTAWLKTHYPCEFMASLLASERKDIERISFLIEECKRMKIEVLPPDINESYVFFSVVPQKNQIRFGLSAIKNVGLGITENIVAERKANGPFKSLNDFISRIQEGNINKKSLESMTKAGVFDSIIERNKILENMDDILSHIREKTKNDSNGQKNLFDNTSFKHEEIHLKDALPTSKSDRLKWEKELLGLFVTSHPLEDMRELLRKNTTAVIVAQRAISGQRIRLGGIISGIKKILTKSGKPMMFITLEDLTGKIEVVVFPTTLEKYQSILEENKIVFIAGKVDHKDGVPKIISDQVEEILEI